MTTTRPAALRGVALLMLALTALLAACAAPDTGGGASRDRVTASDEPDAARRARVRYELAAAYYSRGQLTTALDEVKLAIAADPRLASAFNLRGLIYVGLNEDRLAEESFQRALQLDARNADTMQNYGWFMCQRRRFGEADAMFRNALEQPNYVNAPRTLLTQGICQARNGQWADAERTLQRSYELDAGNPATAVNLSEVLYRRGEFERARFYMRRINGQPDLSNAQTLWLAARIENKLGNRQAVQDLGRELRGRFPQSPEAAALDQGRFDE